MDDIIVTVRDARAVKYCKNGTKLFFEKHNLDWDKFVTEGIPGKLLEGTGDAMAIKLVEVARGR